MRQDVEIALERFGINTFGNKGNLKSAVEKLRDNERVIYIAPTNAVIYTANTRNKTSLSGIVIFTDKRVLLVCKAGISETVESIPLHEVTTVGTMGNGIGGGHITINTVPKTVDIMVSYKKDEIDQICNVLNEAVRAFRSDIQQETTVLQPSVPETADEIGKLFDLKNKGIITEEEFQVQKTKLLQSSSEVSWQTQGEKRQPSSVQYNPNAPVQNQAFQVKPKKSGHGCLVSILILVFFLGAIGFSVSRAVKNEETSTIESIQTYDDISIYSKMSIEQLIEKLGEPKSQEDWTNKTQKGDFAVSTIIYDLSGITYEFIVADDKIVRLTAYSEKFYKGKGENFVYQSVDMSDIVSSWGISLGNETKIIANTGIALRLRPISQEISDLWIMEIEKDEMTYGVIKFTYDDSYFDI